MTSSVAAFSLSTLRKSELDGSARLEALARPHDEALAKAALDLLAPSSG
jgi:hypothetical protein